MSPVSRCALRLALLAALAPAVGAGLTVASGASGEALPSRVFGCVTDQAGAPLADVEVAFHSPVCGLFRDIRATRTDALGFYEIRDLEHLASEESLFYPGPTRMMEPLRAIVSAQAPGFAREYASDFFSGPGDYQIDFALRPETSAEGRAFWRHGARGDIAPAAGLSVIVPSGNFPVPSGNFPMFDQSGNPWRTTLGQGVTDFKGHWVAGGLAEGQYPATPLFFNDGFQVPMRIATNFRGGPLSPGRAPPLPTLSYELDPRTTTLRGLVLGSVTRAPQPSREVWVGNFVYGWDLKRVRTDAAGRFELAGLPVGDSVQVTVPSGLVTRHVHLSAGPASEEETFFIAEPIDVGGTVTVMGPDQSPLANVTLRLWSAHPALAREARTDVEGRFVMPGVLAFAGDAADGRESRSTRLTFGGEILEGGYQWMGAAANGPLSAQDLRLMVIRSENIRTPAQARMPRQHSTHLALHVSPEADASSRPSPPPRRPLRTRDYRGQTVDPGGNPVPGATVRWQVSDGSAAGTVTSDAEGRLSLKMPVNQSLVTARAAGFAESAVWIEEQDPLHLAITLAPLVTLKWDTPESSSPAPVQWTVSTECIGTMGRRSGRPRTVQTWASSAGGARAKVVFDQQLSPFDFPGPLRVVISGSAPELRGLVAVREITLATGPSQEFNLGRLALRPRATLRGRVVDSGGDPVAGALAFLDDREDSPVEIDAEGRFEFRDLLPVPHRLTLFDHAFEPLQTVVALPTSEEEVSFAMERVQPVPVTVEILLPPEIHAHADIEDARPGVRFFSRAASPEGGRFLFERVVRGPKHLVVHFSPTAATVRDHPLMRHSSGLLRRDFEVAGPQTLRLDLSDWVLVNGRFTRPVEPGVWEKWPAFSGYLGFHSEDLGLTRSVRIYRGNFQTTVPVGRYVLQSPRQQFLAEREFTEDTTLVLDGTGLEQN